MKALLYPVEIILTQQKVMNGITTQLGNPHYYSDESKGAGGGTSSSSHYANELGGFKSLHPTTEYI